MTKLHLLSIITIYSVVNEYIFLIFLWKWLIMKYAVETEVSAYVTIIVDAESKEEAVDYVTSVTDLSVTTNYDKIITENIFVIGDPLVRKAKKSDLLNI